MPTSLGLKSLKRLEVLVPKKPEIPPPRVPPPAQVDSHTVEHDLISRHV